MICHLKPPCSYYKLVLSTHSCSLTVVFQGLLAVILSGIQLDQRRHAWAIIRLPKLRIKPCIVRHRAHDEIFQALSPFYVQCVIKSWGGAWERGYSGIALLCMSTPLQICFCAGIVVNEGFNFLLKHLIKEPRPPNGECHGNWGEPSSSYC